MEPKLGDYVIVHELLHFSVPNHGKLWKALMRVHLGDYEELEQSLNSCGDCSSLFWLRTEPLLRELITRAPAARFVLKENSPLHKLLNVT